MQADRTGVVEDLPEVGSLQRIAAGQHDGGRRLGGADIQSTVNLGGIHADNLDRQAAVQRHRQGSLAGRGRTHEKNGRGKPGVLHDQILSETDECEESARGLGWDANFIIFLATDGHR